MPPYRIVTERLVLRCWEPRDAPLLKEAVDSSIDHLLPWMPWAAHEPQSLEEKVALLRQFRGKFDLGQDFTYGIFTRDEQRVVGGTGLHTRIGDEAFEIGYWIRASRAGEGLGTESTAALTRVAFELTDVDRIEIRCEPENERSRAIPRKLGYLEEATLRRRLRQPEPRDVVIYSLFRSDFAASPSAAAAVEAYDAAGTRVL
ncbi:MAG TPA: GNAT family protein [Gaiellaceae bacterium]|nr:GNAT family protein [Gaiellaceae bacterium]